MRFERLLRLFAATFVLLAAKADHVPAATIKTRTYTGSAPLVSDGRFLRVSGAGNDATPSTEERGIMSSIKMWAKTQYWSLTEKSDDYVKAKLGLVGLGDSVMKTKPNYKYLQKFRYKVEGRMLDDWLYEKGYSTQTIWSHYNLEKIPANQLATNAKFRIYYRYANKYDDAIYNHKNSIFEPPIYFDGSSAELNVKVRMWAEKRRPKWYVQEMLWLDDVPNSVLMADPHYKKFLELKAGSSKKS